MAMTLIIAAERPWNRKEKIHRNKNPKEAPPQMLRRRLILVQADHGSWCEVHVPAYWLWLGKNEPNAGIRHAPSMRHISLVFNLARQARKKQMRLQDGKMARWQAAFCNFLPPSGGRIKPTPPTSVEKESA